MTAVAKIKKAPPVENTSVAVAPAATSSTGHLLNIIALAAQNKDVDVDKLTALLALQERVLAKEAEANFNQALSIMSADLPRVQRNGTVDLGGGKGGYKFAKWEDMDTVLRPRMNRHGFTLSFDTAVKEGGGAIILGTLLHSGGHSRTVSIPLALDAGAGRNNLQAMGSTLSYGKRYCAEMLFNIVRTDEDDDAVRGGMAFLNADEVEELSALVHATQTDVKAMLDGLKIKSLHISDVQGKDFQKIRTALLVKKTRMAAGVKDAATGTPILGEDRLDILELSVSADTGRQAEPLENAEKMPEPKTVKAKPAPIVEAEEVAPVAAAPTAPPAEPASPASTDDHPQRSPQMIAWVVKVEADFAAATTPQAMFKIIDRVKSDRDHLRESAPELDVRISEAVKLANARFSPPADSEVAA